MNYIYKLIDNLYNLLYSLPGKVLFSITALLSFFAPIQSSFYIVIAFILSDLFWGILSSRKQNKYIQSTLVKETFKKVGIYSFLLAGIFLMEFLLHEENFWGIKIFTAMVAACELWSISAHMLIIKPDLPILKLLRLHLKSEIDNKLGRDTGDIFTETNTNIEDENTRNKG